MPNCRPHPSSLRRAFARAAAPLAALALAAPAAADLDCPSLGQLSREFLRHHVSQRDLGAEIEKRAIDAYLQRLDTSRSLMLENDAAQLRTQLTGVFEKVRGGDCEALAAAHQRLVAVNEQAEGYVAELVAARDFELDESVEIELDPDDRGHPKTVEERAELWRRLVHFQISNYLDAGEKLPEAKRLLAHRYELRTKRVRELSPSDMFSVFLDAFASALDPHSSYYTPEAMEDFRISMSLSLEGIGVALAARDGYSVVARITPGGAADRLEDGLEPQDKIIAVAEKGGEAVNIIDMPLREAVSRIRGKKGTTVQLTVLRQGETTQRFTLDIVRDKIDLAEQAASLRFETRERGDKTYKLAILDLPSFYGDSDPDERQCTDDVEKLLRQVNEEGVDGLLLDLSRNGGGLLEHAVKISGFFIRKGEVVGVQNNRGQLSVLSDRDERVLYTGPMVVHVSRVSASASEILAGALKDYHRAVITGDDHTYGKGTVQTVTPLQPGLGALKITTARFFRPGGRSTQNDGVAADVVIPSLLATNDLGERHMPYALQGEEIDAFLGSYANAIGPEDRWSRVPAATTAELARRSAERVGASEAFAEVRDKLQEARANNGVVRLSDILEKRKEAKAEQAKLEGDAVSAIDPGPGPGPNGDLFGAPDKDEMSPQLLEAIEVLGDLVELSKRAPQQET